MLSPYRVALLIVVTAACAGSSAPPSDAAADRRADVAIDATPDAPPDAMPDALDPQLYPPGCVDPSSIPPPPDDGCGTPPRENCPRPCGPELDVMCCKGGDRCYQKTADGCFTIRTCTSVADGPCAYHGGPAVYFCGQPFGHGYAMSWVSTPATGWTCSK